MKRVTVRCRCNKFPDHITPCCDFFKKMLNDCYVRLDYLKERNMYGILFVGDLVIQGFFYCPWCGTKLPDHIALEDDD